MLFLMHDQLKFKGTLISFCPRSENTHMVNNQGGFTGISVCIIFLFPEAFCSALCMDSVQEIFTKMS